MNALIKHLNTMTPAERVTFAEKAGSSATSMRLAAHGYKTDGLMVISPEFAARIEAASEGALCRTELSAVCGACPLACASRKG